MAGPSTDKASGRGTGCGVVLRLELLTGALCAEATEFKYSTVCDGFNNEFIDQR
jgi:hypothetical protein